MRFQILTAGTFLGCNVVCSCRWVTSVSVEITTFILRVEVKTAVTFSCRKLVTTYKTTWRHNSSDYILHFHNRKNLKSRMIPTCLRNAFLTLTSDLKMEAASFSETSVTSYKITTRHNSHCHNRQAVLGLQPAEIRKGQPISETLMRDTTSTEKPGLFIIIC